MLQRIVHRGGAEKFGNEEKMRSQWIFAVFLFAMAVICCPQQSSGQRTTTTTILIRMLNGKNGKPVNDEAPNIYLHNAKSPINPRSDSKGEIVVDVSGIEPREIGIFPNYYVACYHHRDLETPHP